ncbi:MAG: type II toxin-antitoxin system HicB family antitoxin [Bacteroidales bacterium]
MKNIIRYKGFIGSVNYAAEDRVFYGKIEGINDLVSFEGSTVDELEKGFKYMVDKHIEDCKKNKIPVEKSYKGNLNIRLSPELHKKAAYNAAIKGVSLNQYINDAIKKEVTSSDLD